MNAGKNSVPQNQTEQAPPDPDADPDAMLDADKDAEAVTTVSSLSAPNMRRWRKRFTSRVTTHIRKRVGRDLASAGGADIVLCARALRDVGDEVRG
jgi:hypothetical protein